MHSSLTRPLPPVDQDCDGLARLLAAEHVARLQSTPPVERLEYTFDMPLQGDGWHTRETNGSVYWRFTGPTSVATLYFPKVMAPERTLRLSIFHAITPEHISELRVIYNDLRLTVGDRDAGHISFLIPEEAISSKPYTFIELLTPPPVMPPEGDDRMLGIGLKRIEIF